MKKVAISLALVLLLFVLTHSYADIGENFSRAGYWIGGTATGGLYVDSVGYSLSLSLEPSASLFLIDNLTIGLYGYVATYRSHNPFYDLGGLSFSVGFSGAYYFVNHPDADSGWVHSIGASLGIAASSYSDGTAYGSSGLTTTYRLFYFLSDRVAPYISVSVPITLYVPPTALSYTGFEAYFAVGISAFFPTRMRVNIPTG